MELARALREGVVRPVSGGASIKRRFDRAARRPRLGEEDGKGLWGCFGARFYEKCLPGLFNCCLTLSFFFSFQFCK